MYTIVVVTCLVLMVLHAMGANGRGVGLSKGRLQGTRAVSLLSAPEKQEGTTTGQPAAGLPNREEVSEDDYQPPIPLPEKHQGVIHRVRCCPEPHCCGVEQMVLKSKGEAEAELAKSLKAVAVMGGVQSEFERKASERRLRSSHKDQEAAVSVALAQAEAESRVAEAEATALTHELGEVKKVNANLEKDEAQFNEELIKSIENEVDEAESDIKHLKSQSHKLAEVIEEDVERVQEEEQHADLKAQLAEMREDSSSSEDAEEAIHKKLEALEKQSKAAAEKAAQLELKREVSEIRARTDKNVNRGRRVLKEANETVKAITAQHPNIAAAEQASLDSIHGSETAATIAQHDTEAEEEQDELPASVNTGTSQNTQNAEETSNGGFPILRRDTASAWYGGPPNQSPNNNTTSSTQADTTIHLSIKPHSVFTKHGRLLLS